MLTTNTKIHFIGIGGIGMSSLAQLLLDTGYIVSGSDETLNSLTSKIESKGGRVFLGHKASNLGDAQVVVYSSAIDQKNTELIMAKKRNIPIFHRAQLLFELMKEKESIAVSGTHGKTTTSCMLSSILIEAGMDPTLILGGELNLIGGNTYAGKGEFVVVEADESDSSFLFLEPKYTVITNIDQDHLDYHKSLEGLIKANLDFAKKTKLDGELFCLFDDYNIRRIILDYEGRFTTFGMSKEADLHATNLKFDNFKTKFNCIYKKRDLGRVTLNIPGEYNVLNSLAAILVSLRLGVDFNYAKSALSNYTGAKRRFDVKLKRDDIMIIEDYAHHPTEIEAVLKASKSYKGKRLVVVFQPHRYSRTKFLLESFGTCFGLADELILTNIYHAWEEPIKELSVRDIYQRVLVSGQRNAHIMPKNNITDYLYNTAQPNDMILVLGAGDIGDVASNLADMFTHDENKS